jgi:hypothetical protein
MRKPRHASLGIIAAAVLVGTGGAIAAQAGGDTSSSRESAAGSPGVSQEVRALLPVFEGSREAADALPPRLEAGLSDRPGGPGVYASLSRRSVTVGSGTVYLVPTAGGVCATYVEGDAAVPSCGTAEQIKAGDTLYGTAMLGCTFAGSGAGTSCGRQLVYGVAPGTASKVRAGLVNGSTVDIRVERNAYAVVLDPAAEVTSVTVGK